MFKALIADIALLPEGQARASSAYLADIDRLNTADAFVSTVQLPANWENSFRTLESHLDQAWDLVLCIGSFGGTSIAIERIAINENDPRLKDADGRRPRSKQIVPDGEPGYWTGLPYRELVARLGQASIPVYASHQPGGFLPNFVFYQLMRWISLRQSATMGGLAQVPQADGLIGLSDSAKHRFLPSFLAVLRQLREDPDRLTFDLNRIDYFKESPKA